jgi:hypothetical protein
MAFIGTFRTQLKAALGTTLTSGDYTLTVADDVIVGYDDLGAAGTLISGIGTTHPKLYITPGVLQGIEPQTRLRRWTVVCNLYFGFARETDNTFADIEGMIEAILTRWDTAANFSGRGIPEQMTVSPVEVDVKQSPVFAKYEIELEVTACS